MKNIIYSIKIDEAEMLLMEGYHYDYHNFLELFNVLTSNGDLTIEVYEKMKQEYMDIAFRRQILMEELSERYKPNNLTYSNYAFNFKNGRIEYYE